MNPTQRTPLMLAGAAALFLVLYIFAYALPRAHANQVLADQISAIQKSQGEIVALIPEATSGHSKLPNPTPDVVGWCNQNILSGGVERRVVANNPYKADQGAQIRLRSLTPAEVASIMSSLANVNLVIDRMNLQDLGGRGSWDLEMFIRIPEAAK